LQVIQNKYYLSLGSAQRGVEEELKPERGRILSLTSNNETEQFYPLAVNKVYYEVILNPSKISRPQNITDILAEVLEMDKNVVLEKVNLVDKRYELLAKNIGEDKILVIKEKLEVLLSEVNKDKIVKEKLTTIEELGVSFNKSILRYYPDKEVGAHILGFLGFDENGISRVGKYGLEAYFEKDLSGLAGWVSGEQDGSGVLLADSQAEAVINGADIVLTIDHTVQYKACKMLEKSVAKNSADSGSLIILESSTGAIQAMCNYPSFDPNEYNKVADSNVYNNLAVYQNYEPGSVMKAISMAIAIDQGKVNPTTVYEDKGEIKFAGGEVIRNAAQKTYGVVDMKKVLAF
jgi:cell division protein FtsI/penicillin-binding protein 2